MKLVNLTPHTITLVLDGATIVVEPAGTVARVMQQETVKRVVDVDGVPVPVMEPKFGDVEGLPDPEDGTMFIVSRMVKGAVPNRDDVVVPGKQLRDAEGRIVGAAALSL